MVNSKKIDPMLTTSDVARLLNIHINTVRRWSNQGILKTYRIGSRGDRRFRQEDITSFLSQELKRAEVGGGENFEKPPAGDVNKLLVNSKV
ncbi:MAG TPA: helix-turn-helix domain-containing protein [Dehalococcoidia bacterium]|nr:helix-turn-helix domain-containing protein [Dehalococcoidia bacterium]